MKSIVFFKRGLVLSALLLTQLACAEVRQPSGVQDPVFGLSFELKNTTLAALPRDVVKACPELVNENVDRLSWVFAQADADDARYYLIGGYWMRRDPVPEGFKKYESDTRGVLLKVSGATCASIMAGDEALMDFDEPEPPQAVRDLLAADLRKRLGREMGGDAQLMRAITRGSVALKKQSSALRRAFAAK